MFLIKCRVSGGVTGTRESQLKAHGVPVVFHTRQDAEDRAKQLRQQMNNEHAVAYFEYWVEEAL